MLEAFSGAWGSQAGVKAEHLGARSVPGLSQSFLFSQHLPARGAAFTSCLVPRPPWCCVCKSGRAIRVAELGGETWVHILALFFMTVYSWESSCLSKDAGEKPPLSRVRFGGFEQVHKTVPSSP